VAVWACKGLNLSPIAYRFAAHVEQAQGSFLRMSSNSKPASNDCPGTGAHAGIDSGSSNPARRRLLATSASSAIVTAAFASGWVRPLVQPAVLPAHAQTTPTTPPGTVPWAYNHTARLASGQPANSQGSGTSPCGDVDGHVLVSVGAGLAGTSPVILLPCVDYDPTTDVGGGPYEIVSWIVNGVDIGAGSGEIILPVSGDANLTAECSAFVTNLAAAMNNLDPEGGWGLADDGVAPSQGGCSQNMVSSLQPEGKTYGPLQLTETQTNIDAPRTWILFPTVL